MAKRNQVIYELNDNENLIFETIKHMHLPDEVVNTDNPCECGKDMYIFYEGLLDIEKLIASSKRLPYADIFDESYTMALRALMKEKDSDMFIWAGVCMAALKVMKKFYQQQKLMFNKIIEK